MELFFASLLSILQWPTFGLMLIGIAIGFVVGLLPGLGGSVTLALMLPFIFDMEPIGAFAFLLGMHSVTATTGDITSVLFAVPGEATAAATILDGYPMTQRGEAGRALGAVLFSSLVGAVFGALVLAVSVGSAALAGPYGPIFPSYMSAAGGPNGVWDVTTLRSPYGPIVPFSFGPRGPVVPFIW